MARSRKITMASALVVALFGSGCSTPNADSKLIADVAILTRRVKALEESSRATALNSAFNSENIALLKHRVGLTANPDPEFITNYAGRRAADPVEKRYQLAKNAFENKKYKTAIAEYESIVLDYPRDDLAPAAQYGAAEAHMKLGSYHRAYRAYNRLYSRWPDSPKAPEARLGAAIATRKSGDVNRSVEELKELIELYPEAPATETAKGILAEMRGKPF